MRTRKLASFMLLILIAAATFVTPYTQAAPGTPRQALTPRARLPFVARNSDMLPPSRRQVQFAGYNWDIKWSEVGLDPGPSPYSDDPADVFVDAQGRLHLTVHYRNGKWYSTEVVNSSYLGYGDYVFHLEGAVDQIDPNVVLGLFTYDYNDPAYAHRELDIELSRWGVPTNDNSQFVVQPYTVPGNMHRFNTVLSGPYSTHGFTWTAGGISFQSLQGNQTYPSTTGVIQSWVYAGVVPPTGNERVRINLWQFNGLPPATPQEVIIDSFTFVPR